MCVCYGEQWCVCQSTSNTGTTIHSKDVYKICVSTLANGIVVTSTSSLSPVVDGMLQNSPLALLLKNVTQFPSVIFLNFDFVHLVGRTQSFNLHFQLTLLCTFVTRDFRVSACKIGT